MRLGTYYSTGHWMVASSCGADNQETLEFGFRASGIRIYNSCGPVLWYNVNGEAASTANDFIAGCHEVVLTGLQTCGLALKTTSTSTAATARPLVGVTSWGE